MVRNYKVFTDGHLAVKAWVNGVPVEAGAVQQLLNMSSLPFIYKHIVAMPDCH